MNAFIEEGGFLVQYCNLVCVLPQPSELRISWQIFCEFTESQGFSSFPLRSKMKPVLGFSPLCIHFSCGVSSRHQPKKRFLVTLVALIETLPSSSQCDVILSCKGLMGRLIGRIRIPKVLLVGNLQCDTDAQGFAPNTFLAICTNRPFHSFSSLSISNGFCNGQF